MTGPIQWNPVGAEPGDTTGLGVLVIGVAAAVVRHHGAQVLAAEVVGPGDRDVGALDDVLIARGVEVAVTHRGGPFSQGRGQAVTKLLSHSSNSVALAGLSASTNIRSTGSVPEKRSNAQLSFSSRILVPSKWDTLTTG